VSLGAASKAKLGQANPKLQLLYNTADSWMSRRKLLDLTILCTHRGEAEQRQAKRDGHSTLDWPNSKHNTLPSNAVDSALYPVDWNDRESFFLMAGYLLAVADFLKIDINVGALWRRFPDLPHVELTDEEIAKP